MEVIQPGPSSLTLSKAIHKIVFLLSDEFVGLLMRSPPGIIPAVRLLEKFGGSWSRTREQGRTYFVREFTGTGTITALTGGIRITASHKAYMREASKQSLIILHKYIFE